MILANALTTALLIAGLFFMLVAAIGFIRLPDIFCRLHVTAILDTAGAPLVLLAAAVHLGAELASVKIALAIVFLFVTSPLVGHLFSRAALQAGHQPEVIDLESDQRPTPSAPKSVP